MDKPSRDDLVFQVFCQKPGWSEGYVNSLSDEELERELRRDEGER